MGKMGTKSEDPTADEIRELCAEIRQHWSDDERQRRTGFRLAEWELPVCSVDRPDRHLIEKPGAALMEGQQEAAE